MAKTVATRPLLRLRPTIFFSLRVVVGRLLGGSQRAGTRGYYFQWDHFGAFDLWPPELD